MGDKTMIVVWKWSVGWAVERGEQKKSWKYYDFIDCKSSFTMEVEGDTSKAYTFTGFTNSNECFEAVQIQRYTQKYNDNDIITACRSPLANGENKVLLLLHGGGDDQFGINSDVYIQLSTENNIHVAFFEGGTGAIYEHIIDGNETYFKKEAITSFNDCIKLKKTNFDSVWNYYYGNHYLNLLNELTVLWCPLTIDIQGLSKLKHDKEDKKYQEYLDKIKDKWDKEKRSLKENHGKIIELLESEENKEEMNSLKAKYSKIIERLDDDKIQDITEDMLVN